MTGRSTRSLRSRGATAVAAVVWTAAIVLLAISIVLTPLAGSTPIDLLFTAASALAVISLATVGAILVSRLPRHAIGWLLLGAGLMLSAGNGLGSLATYALALEPDPLPGGVWIAVAASMTWAPLIIGLGFLLPLLYPTGRLPSRRWRPVAASGAVALAILSIQSLLSPFAPGSFPAGVDNPLGLTGTPAQVLPILGGVATVIGVVDLPLIIASLVLRYRHAAGIERQQLKWLAAVMALMGPFLLFAIVAPSEGTGLVADLSNGAWLCVLFGFALLPIAIGVAVLRYRLYDIDRLISRTLVYGLLAALLAAVYIGSVLLLSALLAPLTSENSLAVAGSTLVVVALFSPVRRRIQSIVDRRFNRARYDGARELADLSQRLRSEVDLDGVKAEVVATVGRTLAPASTSIWLRPAAVAGSPELRQSTLRSTELAVRPKAASGSASIWAG